MEKKQYKDLATYRVAIVGDVHLASRSPRFRIDNYFDSLINKLDYIYKNNDIILYLGDLFDSPILEAKSLYKYINLLKYYFTQKKVSFSIVGNHDISSYNIQKLNESSLGLLFTVGLIKPLKRIYIHNILIDGMEFIDETSKKPTVKPNPKLNYKYDSVLLGHYFYNCGLDMDYSLTDEIIEKMNYKYIFLGHDHKPYPIKNIGKTSLYRGGSICRNTRNDFNLVRQPSYYQLIINQDGIADIVYNEIPALLPNEIFLDTSLKSYDNELNFITDLKELVNSITITQDTNTKKYTIKNSLEELQAPNHVVEFLSARYNENNILLK